LHLQPCSTSPGSRCNFLFIIFFEKNSSSMNPQSLASLNLKECLPQ
jgi:hypothetical protein